MLGVFVPVVGLLTAYTMARFLKLDVGFSAGMLSGSAYRIARNRHSQRGYPGIAITEEQKQLLVGHVAVADAICYIFGTIGVILCCGTIGPKLLGSIFGPKRRRKKRRSVFAETNWA